MTDQVKKKIRVFYCFILFLLKKFKQERCFDIANSLSYTSLLSIVPLMAVIFASLSSFPGFQSVMHELEEFIFSNFIPTSTDVIREYLMGYVGKASSMTLVGILSLLFIALLLMWKIDQVLNHIWSVSKKRNYLKTFLTYWAILTLGPVLIGFSLMATSYLTSLPIISDTAQNIGIKKYLLQSVAIVFTLMAFSLTYLVVPNTRVNLKNAIIGGLVATLLFELSKQGFALYISSNTTYQNIYGALATLPIFLVWIYISWLVILIGAITARCLDLFDFSQPDMKKQNKFVSACYIILYLWQEARQGNGLPEYDLLSKKHLGKGLELFDVIKQLEQHHWIHRDNNENWYLGRDISYLSFSDLYNDLPFELPKKMNSRLLNSIMEPIVLSNKEHLDHNIKDHMENYLNNKTE